MPLEPARRRVLRVGLTGGIGSGKSTVAARLTDLGAAVVDADRVAREVVEPGMPALAAIADRFGSDLLTPEGALDRPALGRVVFGDPAALRDLEAITHPAIWARTDELMAEAAARTDVVVHDMPLLVEKCMAPEYHLVIVVGTSEETRVHRLVEHRGMSEDDARARIRAQASDEQRHAAADAWLDNEGAPADLTFAVEALWRNRIRSFADNLEAGTVVRYPSPVRLSAPDPGWAATAERLLARVGRALGDRAVTLDHVGSTAVPGLPAKDVVDLQVGVTSLEAADDPTFVEAMSAAGFPRFPGEWVDHDEHGRAVLPKRLHGCCDPARPVHLHVREAVSPGWAWARDFRDWLRAEPAERDAYAAEKQRVAAQGLGGAAYSAAKEPWFAASRQRLDGWLATRAASGR